MVKSYTQCSAVCSQAVYDEESQSFVVESQSNEESEIPVKLNFYEQYLNSLGLSSDDIARHGNKERSICDPETQHEFDSQTDIELIINRFKIDNPHYADLATKVR